MIPSGHTEVFQTVQRDKQSAAQILNTRKTSFEIDVGVGALHLEVRFTIALPGA